MSGHRVLEPRSAESAGAPSPWGFFRWAAWLPEVANALWLGLTLALAAAIVLTTYSDSQLRENIVDTYEVSGLAAAGVYLFALIGLVFAGVGAFAAKRAGRKVLAGLQALLLLGCIGSVAYHQHQLKARLDRIQRQGSPQSP